MFALKRSLPLKGAPFYIMLMLLIVLSLTIVAPIFPLFMRQFVKNDAFVGYIFSYNAVLLVIATFIVNILLRSIRKVALLKICIFGYFLTFLGFPLVQNVWQLLILSIFRMFFSTGALATATLLIRDSVKKAGIGAMEGLYFMFMNTAWLIGPVIGGPFAENFGYNWTFVFASVFSLIAFVILMVRNPYELPMQLNEHDHTFQNIKEYFKQKTLVLLYLMSFGLAFFWSLVYTYLPLFLKEQGFSSSLIGYAIALFVVPLIMLEPTVGRFADRFGSKIFLVFGFIVTGVFLGLSFFHFSPVFVVGILLAGCFGAACVEPVREACLFKGIKHADTTRFYTVYSTAFELGSLVAPLFFSSILLSSSFQWTFFSGAVILLACAVCAALMREKGQDHEKKVYYPAPGTKTVSLVSD